MIDRAEVEDEVRKNDRGKAIECNIREISENSISLLTPVGS